MQLNRVTPIQEIESMPLIRPEKAGSHWKGIKHFDLIQRIRTHLDYRRIEILEERYSVSEDRMSLIGVVLISPEGLIEIGGQNYMLCIRHSNDLRYPLVLSVGTRIMVCHNGVITGEYVMRKKHTKNMDLDHEIFQAIRNVEDQLPLVAKTISAMRFNRLESAYETILVGAARNGIYPWSWIKRIDAEYLSPSADNPECGNYIGTHWGLYNAFNYVMRQAAHWRQAESLQRFRTLLT